MVICQFSVVVVASYLYASLPTGPYIDHPEGGNSLLEIVPQGPGNSRDNPLRSDEEAFAMCQTLRFRFALVDAEFMANFAASTMEEEGDGDNGGRKEVGHR